MPTRLLPIALAVCLAAPSLVAAQPEQAPPPHGMPRLQQVELTDATAKAAIDSYVEIKKKYGDDALPTTKAGAVAKGAEVKAGVTDIIDDAGFADVGTWSRTVMSVALAYGVIKEGGLEKLDASDAKIDANPQIPEQMKAQLKAMLASTRPSENNVKIVETLLEDADYGPKLKQIRRS
jgi:hypothetical protein